MIQTRLLTVPIAGRKVREFRDKQDAAELALNAASLTLRRGGLL